MTYAEKLKDPRWQKKRLEILNRDNFTCRCCGNNEKTLHVHHFHYSGSNPWDSKNEDIITLCEECHSAWHEVFDKIDPSLVIFLADLYNKLESDSIDRFIENYMPTEEIF